MDELIELEIYAIEPTALLEHAAEVSIRNTGEIGGAGGATLVVLRGRPDHLADFIADNWGRDELEAYPELAGHYSPDVI